MHGELLAMARITAIFDEADLEQRLLRKGTERRQALDPHCSDCGRTPLAGEVISHFGERPVCALCRAGHAGEPSSQETVRHVEHGVSVRRGLPRVA